MTGICNPDEVPEVIDYKYVAAAASRSISESTVITIFQIATQLGTTERSRSGKRHRIVGLFRS